MNRTGSRQEAELSLKHHFTEKFLSIDLLFLPAIKKGEKLMMSTRGKPITCRAAVCWEVKKPLQIETVIVDPPKPHEVRVKMVAASICHSDLSAVDGAFPEFVFPAVLGHEGTGIVESTGEDVTRVRPGDHVILIWNYQCGECSNCVKGKRNICLKMICPVMSGKMLDGTTRLTSKGFSLNHCTMITAFCEYSVMPERCMGKLRKGVPLEKISMFGCCVPTGYGAAKFTAKVEAGSTVAVIGLGGIGLCTVLGARDCQADMIIGVDINPDKEPLAMKFGATDFVNPLNYPGKLTSCIINELTDGKGVDYAFVCVGINSVIEDAFECIRCGGGELIIVGLPDPKEKLSFEGFPFLFGKTVKGTWIGDTKCLKDIPDLVDIYMKGSLPTDLLITNILPLEKINEGLDLIRQGKSIRTVIQY